MENQSLTLLNRQSELMKSLEPGKIIKAQADKNKTIMLISLLLMKVATLYQIPNWGESQSIILADWIFQNYQFDTLESVIKTLNAPPIGQDKNWRLTPDTISNWMAYQLEMEAIKREVESHNQKQGLADNDIDLLLTEALAIESKPLRPILPLTDEEIKLEGQEEPYIKPYSNERVDEVYILAQKKMQYGRECTDLLTGLKLPDKPSFDEWLLLNQTAV